MDTAEHDNTDLGNSQEGNAGETLVRTSVPGVAACVLAAASLLLLPVMGWAFRKDTSESVRNLYFSAQFGTWLLAAR